MALAQAHERGHIFPFDERIEVDTQTMEPVQTVGPWSKEMRWDIVVPDDAWEPQGPPEDPKAFLKITPSRLRIASIAMHLDAYAVRDDPERGWVSDVPHDAEYGFNSEIDAIHTLRMGDPPDPVEIMGRDYILVCYPVG